MNLFFYKGMCSASAPDQPGGRGHPRARAGPFPGHPAAAGRSGGIIPDISSLDVAPAPTRPGLARQFDSGVHLKCRPNPPPGPGSDWPHGPVSLTMMIHRP